MEVNQLKSLLSRFGIKPNKFLGQNFLLSDEVLDDIVAAADLKSSDTVLEIGPGLGALTQRLAAKAGEVIAVEKDRALAAVLRKFFKNKKNVKIVQGDALWLDSSVIPGLTRDPEDKELDSRLRGNDKQRVGYKLVANIPYYITGKLLQNFLTPSQSPPMAYTGGEGEPFSPSRREGGDEEGVRSRPSLMVLLLQKEVAERIVAKPGDMSILAVSVQFYADPEIISYVPRENFYPVPEVDSAVVRLKVLDRPRFDVDEKKFFQFVKIGFSSKRKQLQNNLIAGLPAITPAFGGGLYKRDLDSRLRGNDRGESGNDRDGMKNILDSLSLNPLCRAEDLSIGDWKRLYDRIFNF